MPAEDRRHSEITRRQNSRTESKPTHFSDRDDARTLEGASTSNSGTGRDADALSDQTVEEPGDLSNADRARSDVATTEDMTVALVGLPNVDLSEFVYSHQLASGPDEQPIRQIALFDIENRGNGPLRWQAAKTKFIGTDGYTYRQAHESLDPAKLGPGCHTRQVEVEPGRKARFVTLVEELPPGVEIAEVVQTVPGRGRRQSRRVELSVA
jgi:hypothetical protein